MFPAEVGSEAQSRELVPSDTQAVYVEPGICCLEGMRVSSVSCSTSGQERCLATRFPLSINSVLECDEVGEFSASRIGTLAYRSGIDTSNQFTWVTRKGTSQLCRCTRKVSHSSLVTRWPAPGVYRHWRRQLENSRFDARGHDPADIRCRDETAPVWSSNGKYVYYRSDNGGVFSKEVDGTSGPVRILDQFINGPVQFLDHPALGPLLVL